MQRKRSMTNEKVIKPTPFLAEGTMAPPNCADFRIAYLGNREVSHSARRNIVKIIMRDGHGNLMWQTFAVETLLETLEEYRDR